MPVPLVLLTLANSLHSFAMAQQPTLTRRPTSARHQQKYDMAWTAYARSMAACIVVLRKAIDLLSQHEYSGLGSGRIELRARVMLTECLIMVGSTVEAEKVLNKAASLAQQHESLSPFRPFLSLLSASLYISSTSPTLKHATTSSAKFAKSILRRVLSTTPLGPSWKYRILLTLVGLPESTYTELLSHWRDIAKVADKRHDLTMGLVARLGIARTALAEGDCNLAESTLKEMDAVLFPANDMPASAGTAEGAMAPPQPMQRTISTALLPSALQVHYSLIYALLKAHTGDVKEARDKLRMAHALLDRPESAKEHLIGEQEGWVKILLSPNESGSTETVKLKVPAKSTIYSFAFLASAAIHRDPFGSKPRSTLFAAEGLKLLESKLSGTEHLPSNTTVVNAFDTLAKLARVKIHLLLFSAELSLMRSAFAQAEEQYMNAISTARQYSGSENELWLAVKDRVTLGMGCLYQARGQDDLAEDCFETVLAHEPQSSVSTKAGVRTSLGGASVDVVADRRDSVDVVSLAKLGFLLLKISQGHIARLSTMSSSSSSRLTPTELRLTRYAQDLVALGSMSDSDPLTVPTTAFKQGSPTQLVSDLVLALTKGEITKAKHHLSRALNSTNVSSSNHAKALILALLANLFLWTRNEQAQKMLLASAHIAKGMGARISPVVHDDQKGAQAQDVFVGNAPLGLWTAQKLLESYERTDPNKVQSQIEVIKAHKATLQADIVSTRTG
ncbi:hypothetical protein OIV83_005322 [Microbotryomycetes sp. JL201]|nr:hypothetical protein OIV83_005322 [Microbotryomycetes sp. JL201]